jgi:hypothetical protein
MIKKNFIAQILNGPLEQRIVYLIIMAVLRDALTRIVYSSYIYKMYYFMLPASGGSR